MPMLKVIDSDALNAFATGLNQRQYSITVTTGLMKRLNDQEMEAVLGHELTHIRNGDVQMMVVAMVIAGVVSFFGEMLFRGFTNGACASAAAGLRRRATRRAAPGAAILIAVVLISGGVAALGRRPARAVALARISRRRGLGGADEKSRRDDLGAAQDRGPQRTAGSPSAVMEMCIDNPRTGFSDLFATHPSVEGARL